MDLELTQRIQWAPFSLKQKLYIRDALKSRIAIAEGAVRSGKTVCNNIIFAAYLEKTPDKLHLVSGASTASALMNVCDSNGMGLEYIFRGRCRRCKYLEHDALRIQTQTGEKIVIFVGSQKADSYKKILGNSFGGWLWGECDTSYDSDDPVTSFVKVAFARQLAAKHPITIGDLNPQHPAHPIYSRYVDAFKDSMKPGEYVWQRFVIDDNLSVSDESKDQIKRMFHPVTSATYRRNILGERVAAEGLIYRIYADEPSRFDLPASHPPEQFVVIGADVGGSDSKTVFTAAQYCGYYDTINIIDAHKIDGEKGQITADRFVMEFEIFARKLQAQGHFVKYVFVDNEAVYLLTSLRKAGARMGLYIEESIKTKILDRIHAINSLFAMNRLYVDREKCPDLADALCTAVWDPKKVDTRLDNFTSDVDSLDSMEYTITPFLIKLLPEMKLSRDGGE